MGRRALQIYARLYAFLIMGLLVMDLHVRGFPFLIHHTFFCIQCSSLFPHIFRACCLFYGVFGVFFLWFIALHPQSNTDGTIPAQIVFCITCSVFVRVLRCPAFNQCVSIPTMYRSALQIQGFPCDINIAITP